MWARSATDEASTPRSASGTPMARTFRRRAVHSVNASLLAATLSFPAGLASATAALQAPSSSRTSAVGTTPPPSPGDSPPPSSTPSNTPTPSGTTSAPTGASSDQEQPPDSDQSSQPPGSGDTGRKDTDPLAEQRKQIDETATRLNGTKGSVPEELAPTVDELTTTLEAVKDPGTSLRDRQGVIESVEHLTIATQGRMLMDPGWNPRRPGARGATPFGSPERPGCGPRVCPLSADAHVVVGMRLRDAGRGLGRAGERHSGPLEVTSEDECHVGAGS